MKTKDILKYVLSALLAVVLLWFSFKDVNWTDFWTGLKECRWEFVICSMLIGELSFLTRSLRWKMMLDPLDPSLRLVPVVNAINISYLVNLVIPRGGDVLRCGYIAKHSAVGEDGRKKASFDKVLGTAVMDRIWDGVFMLLLFVVVLSVLWKRYGAFVQDNILGSVAAKRNTVLALMALAVAGLAVLWAIYRFRERSKLISKVWTFIQGLFEGLGSFFKMKRWWLFLIYTVMVWVCYWFMSATIIRAVQGMDPAVLGEGFSDGISRLQSLDLFDALFLCLIGAVSTLVPVPGGFGAFHYLVSLFLSVMYGIPMEIGIIFATLSHESQTITQIICGGGSYIAEMK